MSPSKAACMYKARSNILNLRGHVFIFWVNEKQENLSYFQSKMRLFQFEEFSFALD